MIAIRRTRTSSVVTASLLALACVVTVGCARPAAHSGAAQTATRHHYGAIIDAGSSGSRIAIFEWRIAGNGDPHVWPVVSMADTDVDPKGCPLTDLPTEEDRVCGCLRALTTAAHGKAARFLGELRLPPIALWVNATAGVRYEKDAARRDATLTATTRCLGDPAIADRGSRYRWKGARVISGEEEGVYAWLAVNHAARTLRSDLGSTFGIVEIGGKSAQIAFRVAGPTLPREARGKILAVPLASGTLHVYALSQELGQNAAKASLDKDVVKDCGPGGNTGRCIAGIERFLCPDILRGACEHRRPDLVPPGAMPFAGLSNFAYATWNLGLADLPLATVRDRATQICGASYDASLRDAFLLPAGRFASSACFSALYVTQVAELAWGIPPGRIAPPRAEWADPSWPLGAMLMEALASTTSPQ